MVVRGSLSLLPLLIPSGDDGRACDAGSSGCLMKKYPSGSPASTSRLSVVMPRARPGCSHEDTGERSSWKSSSWSEYVIDSRMDVSLRSMDAWIRGIARRRHRIAAKHTASTSRIDIQKAGNRSPFIVPKPLLRLTARTTSADAWTPAETVALNLLESASSFSFSSEGCWWFALEPSKPPILPLLTSSMVLFLCRWFPANDANWFNCPKRIAPPIPCWRAWRNTHQRSPLLPSVPLSFGFAVSPRCL
mmetsp:Transcript_10581/g.22298  ORF Transcript_10581/g.22298 Transcript_10581/m.22298 type:complete len:247 (+) Transcript_10581:729-1469(+)